VGGQNRPKKSWAKILAETLAPLLLGIDGGVQIPWSRPELHRVELPKSQPFFSLYGPDLISHNNL
jgi:hypothetical protein